MLVRLGSGGFASGYSAKLDSDDGKYGAVRIGGRKVSSSHVKPVMSAVTLHHN